jgi:putative transposase
MPWREPMSERERLVRAYLADEVSMAELCRRAGVSRKTGYKWVQRFGAAGTAGLRDRSRAPHTHPQAIPAAQAQQIVTLRATHPTWGPRKLRAYLAGPPPAPGWPATSTIGALLQRHGLSVRRRRRAHTPPYTQPLAHADAPNAVWCADFKGSFTVGDGTRVTPLTITDAASRYCLRCQALTLTDTAIVQPLFDATFREFGLPQAIRTDNGPPFASTGLAGLSRLSIWWLKLGVVPERITPAKPQENGRHERFHRTLKADTARPPAASLPAQQRAFDRFRPIYNEQRPHEALAYHTPATHYTTATRPYTGRVPPVDYPAGMSVRRVRHNGEIRWRGGLVYVSEALAGEPVGLDEVGDGRWQLCFGTLPLGTVAVGATRVTPVPRPTPRRRPRSEGR